MAARYLIICSALLVLAGSRIALAVTWTVTNTDSVGTGSLKAAIDSANNGLPAVLDTIVFAIPGAGPHVLTRKTPLIAFAPGLRIDGYTQPGASVNTLGTGDNAVLKIVLFSDSTNMTNLRVLNANCTIRGLVVGGSGIGIEFQNSAHTVVEGNYIGVGADGTTPYTNDIGLFLINSDSCRVGGDLPSQRNLISGTGTAVSLSPVDGGLITGNYIGTDKNGTSAVANNTGVYVNACTGVTIGGTTAGAGNVISGNALGIYLVLSNTGTMVQGNLIGTDATGLVGLGNTNEGISFFAASHNVIGGTTAAERNVISATPNWGILMSGDADSNQIMGNFIGTDRTGLVALGNNFGIQLGLGSHDNVIGGSTPAHRNVIAGNLNFAIMLTDSTYGNDVFSNYIGVGADGTTALGNGGGVWITNGANDNSIGSYFPSMGNTIAHSTMLRGVEVSGAATVENRILGNSITDNLGLGIDLGGNGVTNNDTLDADSGPNNLMNFPRLLRATHLDTGIELEGIMMGEQGEASLIQVFWNSDCDPTGYGEGDVLFDTFTVVKDPIIGGVQFARFIDSVLPLGSFLSATATWAGSTSEFSQCVKITPPAVGDTLKVFLFSPVSMVVTDPVGDSIGIDSASGVIFNTILSASSYDTTSDVNSPGLTGPDGSDDDVVTIPTPMAGPYQIRLFVSDTTGSSSFTMAIRINGNQLLVPDDYQNQSITALGNTVDPVFYWTAATTLPGDANADGKFTSADIIYLVNYVFKSGPSTPVPGHGDANCSGTVTSADIIHMVNFVFKGGPPPCSQSGG